MFEAHSDYIRCIAVHPTQPYILTSSGMLVNLSCHFVYVLPMHIYISLHMHECFSVPVQMTC